MIEFTHIPQVVSSLPLLPDCDGRPAPEAPKFPGLDRGEDPDPDPAPCTPERDGVPGPLGLSARALGSVDGADRALIESPVIASGKRSVPASDRCEPPPPLGKDGGTPPRGPPEDATLNPPEG